MTHYEFRVEGRKMGYGNTVSSPVTRVYVVENKEQARTIAQMEGIHFGIGGRITRLGSTREPLDSRVEGIKELDRLRLACAG
jgi:hypothetical protein